MSSIFMLVFFICSIIFVYKGSDFMYRKNDVSVEQTSLFSKTDNWSSYKLKRVTNGWPQFFRINILPNIDEEAYRVLYSDVASRPNTPINFLVGSLILKSLLELTDEELIDAILFNEQVQYALGTLEYDTQPISKNMYTIFRAKLFDYEVQTGVNLFDNTMHDINDQLIKISNISTSLKRVDSYMISSSCKNMQRTELIYTINKRFVILLDKLGLPFKGEFKKYLDKDNQVDVLYRIKETEVGGKIETLLNQSISLYKSFKHNPNVNNSKEFKQLERLINDQYDNTSGKPKDGKDIKPTSMQTPYDEDATYRYKYQGNKGYVGNVVEAVDLEKNLKLITDWDVDQNIKSDKEFMNDIIDEKKEKYKDVDKEEITKETIVGDAGYFCHDTYKKAQEANIELHPTDMTGHKDDVETNLGDFVIDEENKIIKCPNEKVPITSEYIEKNKTIYADFAKSDCEGCKLKNTCPIRELKNKNKITTSRQKIELARIRALRENSDEYKNVSRLRAGIEGIPSVLRRRYNIDNRPIKGKVYLCMWHSASILSINIKRLVINQNNDKNSTNNGSISSLLVNFIKNIFGSSKYFIFD